MANINPERLILKIPKWLWKLIGPRGVAFCATRTQALSLVLVSIGLGFFEVLFPYYVQTPFLISAIGMILWVALLAWSILLVLPTIVIRKDCFECQFGFHIIAHERNHLRLRKSEKTIEEETLKQTGDCLIPLLLSNPKICKRCPFWLRQIYSQATFKYVQSVGER